MIRDRPLSVLIHRSAALLLTAFLLCGGGGVSCTTRTRGTPARGLPMTSVVFAAMDAPIAATSLHLNETGRIVACGQQGSELHIWLPLMRRDVGKIGLTLRHVPLRYALTSDGSRLATYEGKSIMIVDAATGTRVAELATGQNVVTTLAFSHDGKSLLSGHNDGTIAVWSLATKTIAQEAKVHDRPVTCIVGSLDDALLATGGDDHVVTVRDMRTLRLLCSFRRQSPRRPVSTKEPEGAVEGKGPEVIGEGHSLPVTGLCFSKDGRLLFSGDADRPGGWSDGPLVRKNTVRAWDLLEHRQVAVVEVTGTAGVSALCYLPREDKLAASFRNGAFIVWSVVPLVSRVQGVLAVGAVPAQDEVDGSEAEKKAKNDAVDGASEAEGAK